MTEQFDQQWGDSITIMDGRDLSDLEEAIRETRERIVLDLLGEAQPRRRKWTWKDRFDLAWSALRGKITWDDIV